jgi:hypothetical protein
VELKGLWFEARPGKKRKKKVRPYLKNKPGLVVHFVISTLWEAEVGGSRSRLAPGQKHKT